VKAMVVYDSQYGNTAKIAQAIGGAIGSRVVLVGDVSPLDLKELDLLIVGSPTHGGWYTPGIKGFLEALPPLEGFRVVAFDTRTASIWNRLLPFGYAAPRIARKLEGNGGTLLAPPEGFVVLGIEGPLKAGELERAAGWARALAY
jgi:flavodoxin